MPPTVPAIADRRPLYALLIATIVSLLGSQFTTIALPWFVLTTTGSAAKAGLVGFASLLPGLMVGIFGGVFVDRFGYKRVSIIADVVSGLGIVAIPLCYDTIGLEFWQLLLFVFIASFLKIPALTAHRSMVPELARHAGMPLDRANALFESLQSLAMLLGMPIAGVLVSWMGARNVLWLDAATYAIAALLVAIVIPARMIARPHVSSNGYLRDIAAGLLFIRRDVLLFPMVILLATTNALNSPLTGVILPVYVEDTFTNATPMGIILAATGAGAFIGASLYGAFANRLSRTGIWMSSFMIVPLQYWVFTISPPLALLVTTFLFVGIFSGPLNPLMVTIRHERSPEALRGRVFSTYSAVSMAAQPFGILIGGILIDRVGVTPTVVILGSAAQLCGLIALLAIPAFRQMDALRPRPASATTVIAEV